MKNLILGSLLFTSATAWSQETSLSPITLNDLSNNSIITQTYLLEGLCNMGSPISITGENGQSINAACDSGSFSQEYIFPSIGFHNLQLSQQVNENLALNFSINLTVIADVDTTPPALALTSPANGSDTNRTTTLIGTCEEGITVHYLAGSTYGSFPCTNAEMNHDFVFPEIGNYNFYMRQTDDAGNVTTTRTFLRVAEDPAPQPDPGPETDPEPTPGGNHQNSSSNGALAINGIRASRLECTSPCPVVLSADRITDSTSENPFVTSGYYWDYGDSQADELYGTFEKGSQFFRNNRQPGTGASREFDVNTPIGMHTYHCAEGTCEYQAGVAARNNNGDWATEWVTIVVHAQASQYPAAQTVCVSQSGNWGGDNPCPAGAQQVSSIPSANSWQSNTRYLLRRGESFPESCIAYNLGDIIIDDFGNSADSAPEIAELGLGHDGSCADTIPNDSRIANYSRQFWIENITLNDLRVPRIDIGMTFKDLTINNLDMDFENQPSGGTIFMPSANACSNRTDLTCSSIPLPQGLYISGTRIIGSRQQLPGVNISLMSSACISFLGIIDTETEIAFEHNIRLECGSRVVALHSDLNGNHRGTNGNKHAMTIRPDGYLNQDMIGGYKIDTSAPKSQFYDNRYIVAKGLYLGTPESINNSARVTFTASNGGLAETTRYGLVSDNISNLVGGSGSGPAYQDASLQGIGLVCYSDNDWSPNAGCSDHRQRSIPDGFYEEAITDMTPPTAPSPPASY